MNVIVYFRADALLIFRRNIYALTHQHHGIQITLTLDEQPFEAVLDQRKGRYRGLIIGSDYPHRVVGQGAWIATLLLNPETVFARRIQTHVLATRSYCGFDPSGLPALPAPAVTADCQPLNRYLSAVGKLLIPPDVAISEADARIEKALAIVQQQSDSKIAAKAIAEQLYLSESRLIHLFKHEIGIPIRRYLLWQRLLTASTIIARGESFTFAAHEAGFTDSAHLSRTFSKMFGLRVSDIFGDREAIQVIFCEAQTSQK